MSALVYLGIAFCLNCIGFLVYRNFSVPWVSALNKSPEEIRSRPAPGLAYFLAFLRCLVMIFTLDHYLRALGVYQPIGGGFLSAGFHATLLGLGFCLLPLVNHHIFTHGVVRGLKLSLIDGAYDFLSLALAAMLLVAWETCSCEGYVGYWEVLVGYWEGLVGSWEMPAVESLVEWVKEALGGAAGAAEGAVAGAAEVAAGAAEGAAGGAEL